jgi:hypothetical protein
MTDPHWYHNVLGGIVTLALTLLLGLLWRSCWLPYQGQ